MASVAEIMQLCRLCLVKDQVNIPIFEEQGDIRQIFLKITACLPVKVSREDNLPKKICDGCLYKLELLYQFWNTTVNAEKQLLTWLNQAGVEVNVKTSAKGAQHSDETNQLILKQETVDPSETRADNVAESISLESQRYVMQQQQLPYESFGFAQSDFAEGQCTDIADATQIIANETLEEPTRKRKRRAAAIKALPIVREHSEDVDDVEPVPVAKMENDSDDDDDDDDDINDADDAAYAGLSNTDNEQPGPSGVGTSSVETPPETPILRKLIFGPSMTVKVQNKRSSTSRYIKAMSGIKREISDEEENANSNNVQTGDGDFNVAKKFKEEDAEMADDEDAKIYTLEDGYAVVEPYVGPNSQQKANESVHCDACDKTFKNSVEFGLHSIIHNTNNKYSCHMCKYTSSSKYHFEMHIRAHEGSTKYKCEICNKAFTVSTHAIEHKYFHTGEKPFQCEICGKHFMFSWFLTSHRRTQHWEIMTGMPLVKYDCTICNKHYTSSTGLKRHKLSKHNDGNLDPSVLCDICGKRLASKEKLKFHRRTHTGYKPFGCNVCGKSFSRKEQLKEHERVHTGEKPYICKFCGKGFTQRSPLRIHERIHTGERPYICRLCNKGFISKGVMDTHMKNCDGIPVSS